MRVCLKKMEYQSAKTDEEEASDAENDAMCFLFGQQIQLYKGFK
jgi:hypothetical protein